MNGNPSSKRPWRRAILSGLLAMTVIAGAIGTYIATEHIIWFCPPIAILGLLLANSSPRRDRLYLFALGIFTANVTGLLALLIAIFRWSPSEATITVRVLMTLNAIVGGIWGIVAAWVFTRSRYAFDRCVSSKLRFSILQLLVIVTAVGVLSALSRHLSFPNEYTWFAGYGISILVISVAIAALYRRRI